MKTLLFTKKQNTQDEHLELLELKNDLKKLASTILSDAEEIDAFFETQLRVNYNRAAITPKANWSVIKKYVKNGLRLIVLHKTANQNYKVMSLVIFLFFQVLDIK